jgi:hypothetical protein
MIVTTYHAYLGFGLKFALLLIAFFGIALGDLLLRICRTTREGSLDDRYLPPSDIILIIAFLGYPVLLFVLTKLLHGGYTPRYGWPAILGLVLGLVYLLRAIGPSASAYLLPALLITFVFQGGGAALKIYKSSGADERWTSLVELSRSEPNIPVVIADPLTYLEAAEYSPPEIRDRLVAVIDAEMATRLAGTDTTGKTIGLLAEFVPLHVENLAAFQSAHEKFLLRSGGSEDWFTDYLVQSKYHLMLFSTDANNSLYIVER